MADFNSFDSWQKDAFFFAAEEVQNSADAMESMHRLWLRERIEGHENYVFIDLRRELQTALGTAKWQLEEFEKAVRESYSRRPADKSTIVRHNQFILAITEKIDLVQNDLGEAFIKEGKEPFRWIHLNKDECNDLALFLSPPSPLPKPETSFQETRSDHDRRFKDSSFGKMKCDQATSPYIDIPAITSVSQRTKGTVEEKRESCLENLKAGMIARLTEKDNPVYLKRSVRTTILLALAVLLVGSFVLYSS